MSDVSLRSRGAASLTQEPNAASMSARPTSRVDPPEVETKTPAELDGGTTIGFRIAAAVLLLAGIVSVASLLRFESDAAWVAHTHQVIEQTQTVLTRIVEVQSGQRGYIITGDPEFLAPYEAARNAILSDVERLHDLTADNAQQQATLTDLDPLIAERLRFASQQVELRRSLGVEAAAASVAGKHGEEVTTKIWAKLSEMADFERALLTERGERSSASARVALLAIGGLTAIAFGVLGLTASRIRREIHGRALAQAHVERLNTDLEKQTSELAMEVVVRQAAEEAARRRNEDLKGFAYTVSHDLKAPLRGIAGYAQELERRHQEGLAERARFCITQIITAAKNLDNLIDDLLRYARLDAEPPKLSNVNMSDLVASLLRDRKHALAEGNVEVKVSVPPDSIQVWERGLHQVLANLIDNAIKYSRNSQPPKLRIESEVSGGLCRLSVADNGIGFDMKYHDRIFGLFNRLVRANEFEGTGAGLAIVKKVVEKLEGSIHAQSAPGAGATFFVEIPSLQDPRSKT